MMDGGPKRGDRAGVESGPVVWRGGVSGGVPEGILQGICTRIRVAEQWNTRGAHCEEGSNTSDEEFPVEWTCFWNKVEGWRSLDNG